MFTHLFKRIKAWSKNSNQKRLHKKLIKCYIKALKETGRYKPPYGRFKIHFQESTSFDFAPLLEAIAIKAELNNTAKPI